MIKADGFDAAIIGIDEQNNRIVYDKNAMCQILMKDGLSEEDAWEYLSFNVWCAYVGENTPLYIDLMNHTEVENYYERPI